MKRGIRNNNPLNIKSGADWRGLMAREDMTDEQKAEQTFCVFRGPWWGFRAAARILQVYFHRHGLNTVKAVINRWAPGSENPTFNYQMFVADQMGVDISDPLDLDDFDTVRALLRAMTLFENGAFPYTYELDAGLLLADIEPDNYDLAA